jgi:hypothetical protein
MRRERGYAVAAAVAGAGLALLAASRAWSDRAGRTAPAGLATTTDPLTGGDLYPWLPALALAALAGGGALLATRGVPRTAVGGLLMACGAGIVLGAAYAVAQQEVRPWWPVVAAVGGLAVFDAGWLTVRRGRSWPALGARYERRAADDTGTAGRVDSRSLWDALDRGGDPTQDPTPDSTPDPTAGPARDQHR